MHTFSVISGFLEEPTWQHCEGYSRDQSIGRSSNQVASRSESNDQVLSWKYRTHSGLPLGEVTGFFF